MPEPHTDGGYVTVLPGGLRVNGDGLRCWVMTDSDGNPWPEESPHFTTEHAARERMESAREDYDVEDAQHGPVGLEQIPEPCLLLFCAACGVEYDGGEWSHTHFPGEDPQVAVQQAEDSEWKRGVDGGLYCEGCSLTQHVDHRFVRWMDDSDLCQECDNTPDRHRFVTDGER